MTTTTETMTQGGIGAAATLQILERGAALGFPAIECGALKIPVQLNARGDHDPEIGEAAWRLTLPQLTRDEARALVGELTRLERVREQDRRDEERRLAMTPDPALAREAAAQRQRDYEEYVRERPERTEKLLERIAAALDTLVKRGR